MEKKKYSKNNKLLIGKREAEMGVFQSIFFI